MHLLLGIELALLALVMLKFGLTRLEQDLLRRPSVLPRDEMD
jgi:hypothetical protein